MYRHHRSANLCDTNVTIDKITEILRKVTGIEGRLQSFKAEKIGLSEGFLSNIIRVELNWGDEDTELPESLVLKIPTVDALPKLVKETTTDENAEKFADHATILVRVHENECMAYQWLIETEHPAKIPFPKIYHTEPITEEHCGMIMMEDLSTLGFTVSMSAGISLGQLLSIAEALASVHASSLLNQNWQEKFHPSPRMKFEQLPDIYENMSEKLKENYPEIFGENIDLIEKFYDTEKMYEIENFSHEQMGLEPVIVHGDLWSCNLMFDKIEPDRLLALIDWQGIHKGNLSEDLARVLVSGVNPEMRREETENVLKFYHERLCEKVGDHFEISFDQIKGSFEKILPLAMCFFVAALPFIVKSPIVEGENKDEAVEKMLHRGKAIIEDVLANDA